MDMIDDEELARRSIAGFGEMIAALGRWGLGAEAEIRWSNAIGADLCGGGEPVVQRGGRAVRRLSSG